MADYEIEVSIPNIGPAGPQGPAGEFGELEAPEDGIIYGRRDGEWVDMTAPANLQVRRGTAAEVAAITPLEGEPVWATDTKELVVGDGATLGGVPVTNFPVVGQRANSSTPGKLRSSPQLGATGTGLVDGNARGDGSVDLQMHRLNATAVASGTYSAIFGGRNNTASQEYATVINGNTATASHPHSLAFGSGANAGADQGIAIGGSSTVSAKKGLALNGGIADRCNMIAHAADPISGFFSRAQAVQFVFRAKTSNATPTDLALGQTGSTPVPNERLTIPSGVALFGTVEIIAFEQTNATAYAHYIRKFGIQNLNGTTALVGSVSTVGTDEESDAGYNVSITADNAFDYLKISVTGDSSKTLRWVAVLRGVELNFTGSF
jgi:hypothetical protein